MDIVEMDFEMDFEKALFSIYILLITLCSTKTFLINDIFDITIQKQKWKVVT